MTRLRAYTRLCRNGIAFFAAGSALTAYLLGGGRDASVAIRLVLGVHLLACGASALNQYQERDLDARMERTCRRPLPAGTLAHRSALLFALLLVACGLLVLTHIGAKAAALGTFALLWYNGLYTPLKRRTAFAAAYGALVGAVPPAIGWVAAGASLLDRQFMLLATLLLLWQMPHFWLLLLRRESDYRAAGLPLLADLLGPDALGRITLLWTVAAATTPLLLPLFGIIRSPVIAWSLLPLLVLTVASALWRLRDPASPLPFRWINTFLAILMTLLSLDSLLHKGE
jgi:protoheme IX farnesyltransferase